MPLGPAQEYLAKFNEYVLPGYVQTESFDSTMNVADHYAPYADGSLSEQTGLQNKVLTLTLKVWEPDYGTCKDEVQRAATILRSKRAGFAPLYVQKSDRFYEAMAQTIRYEKGVPASMRTLDYDVTFECKPWAFSASGYSISGTGTINTDSTARDITHGGWTPATVTVTGTNVTVSGYTETGDFAGYFSTIGAVSNLVVNSNNFTALQGGVNKNAIMNQADYRIWVGPGKTNYAITGASSCTIQWNNRWYL